MVWIGIVLLGVVMGSVLHRVIERVPHALPLFKCSSCKSSFSIEYFLVLLLSVTLSILIFYKNGIHLQSFMVAMVFLLFLALSVIDFHYHMVPDSINLLALTLSVLTGSILHSLEAALLMMGFMTALRFYVSYFMEKEAMGEGDIILGGTMAGLMGMQFAMVALFLSALIALPIAIGLKNRNTPLPFVPFLSLALFLVFFFDDYAKAYLQSIGLG